MWWNVTVNSHYKVVKHSNPYKFDYQINILCLWWKRDSSSNLDVLFMWITRLIYEKWTSFRTLLGKYVLRNYCGIRFVFQYFQKMFPEDAKGEIFVARQNKIIFSNDRSSYQIMNLRMIRT